MRVKEIAAYSGHAAPIYHLEVENGILYSAAGDSVLAAWDTEKNEAHAFSIKAESGLFTSLVQPELVLIGNSKGNIHIINRAEKREIKNLNTHANGVFFILKVSEFLITGGGRGVVNFLDSRSFKLLRSLKLSSKKMRSAVACRNGKSVYLGCGEGTVRRIELDYFNEISTRNISKKSINSLALHPRKPVLVTSSADGFVRVLDQESLAVIVSFPAHNDSVYKLSFSPDGKYLLTVSKDKTFKIWNADSLNLEFKGDRSSVDAHKNSINSSVWFSNEEFFTAGDDKSIKRWKISWS